MCFPSWAGTLLCSFPSSLLHFFNLSGNLRYSYFQADEATAVERLRQLEQNSAPSSQKSLQMKETKEVSSANKPLVDFSVV